MIGLGRGSTKVSRFDTRMRNLTWISHTKAETNRRYASGTRAGAAAPRHHPNTSNSAGLVQHAAVRCHSRRAISILTSGAWRAAACTQPRLSIGRKMAFGSAISRGSPTTGPKETHWKTSNPASVISTRTSQAMSCQESAGWPISLSRETNNADHENQSGWLRVGSSWCQA